MPFFNRVSQFTATTGQGTITLGTETANNMLTLAEAGAVDGDISTFLLEDGDNFELFRGTVGGSVTTLARDTVLISKDGGIVGTAKLDLTGAARVRAVESADDLNDLLGSDGQFTSLPDVGKTAGFSVSFAEAGSAFVYNSASGGTAALPSVAGAANEMFFFKVVNTGSLTIDPDSTQLIEGFSTLVLPRHAAAIVWPNASKTAWRAIVFPAIVGTVSENGGVPTGAIIESGSNGNGSYTKFADGTLICRALLTTSNSNYITWTFPAAFIDGTYSAVGTATQGTEAVRDVTVSSRTASSCQVQAVSSANARGINGVAMIAIGRWF